MKTEGESSSRGLRARRGEGEAHFLLRTQGRKFMNGSHLSSCSECKQHTWTKKKSERALGAGDASNWSLSVFDTHVKKKQRKSKSSDMFKLF